MPQGSPTSLHTVFAVVCLLPQSMTALCDELDGMHKQPSPLAAAQAAKQEVLTDQRKFQEVIAGNQVRRGLLACAVLCTASCATLHALPPGGLQALQGVAYFVLGWATRSTTVLAALQSSVLDTQMACCHALLRFAPSCCAVLMSCCAVLCRPSVPACRRSWRSDRLTWRPRRQHWRQCAQVLLVFELPGGFVEG